MTQAATVQAVSSGEPRFREDQTVVSLPDGLVRRLLGPARHVLQEVQRLVQPFRLRFEPAAQGIAISGDLRVRTAGEKFLTELARHPGTFLDQAESTATAKVKPVLDRVLGRELAVRLDGLMSPVKCRTFQQLAYLDDLLDRDAPLVFGVGSTGTGKTHLALASAVNLLATERIRHIVVTRPHLIREGQFMTPSVRWELSMDEQFTPILDVLCDLTSSAQVEAWRANRQLELVPTGLLRGRTFNQAMLLVDEAQNMTIPLLRTAVTRLGNLSRLVVMGDPKQVDLHTDEASGLDHLLDLVSDEDLAIVHRFDPQMIMRNPLVARLEQLYADDAA